MDSIKLDGHSVLHVVDRDIKFEAACFSFGESSSKIQETFISAWVSTCVSYPECYAVDQELQFQNDWWKNLLQTAWIKLHPSGVKSQNALGVGERYREFLTRTYSKIKTGNPTLFSNQARPLAVKALKDTAGPNGHVPTILVIGLMPRLPINPRNLLD